MPLAQLHPQIVPHHHPVLTLSFDQGDVGNMRGNEMGLDLEPEDFK
jgi:hypothetical protein